MSSSSEEEFVEEEEDSDDEPLSKLKANGKKSKQSDSEEEEGEEPEDDDDDDDGDAWEDEDAGSSKKRKSAEESDDSDDDDIPLSALASNKKPKNGNKKVATPSKAKKVTKKATKTKTKAKTPIKKESSDYQSASAALYGSECKKGLLIQRLLCRWWFGIAWPDPSTLPDEPPLNYDALDGFPGVYVCTQGDDVGKILDMRDMEECPNFKNFAKKSSAELQTLLISAIEKQKEELIKVDGKGTPTENELNTMLKWANKVNPSQADKEAAKVLKAAGLHLD